MSAAVAHRASSTHVSIYVSSSIHVDIVAVCARALDARAGGQRLRKEVGERGGRDDLKTVGVHAHLRVDTWRSEWRESKM